MSSSDIKQLPIEENFFFYIEKAANEMEKSEWKMAVRFYQLASALNQSSFVFKYMGYALFMLQDYHGASIAYRDSILIDDNDADAHLGLGTVLLREYENTKNPDLLIDSIVACKTSLQRSESADRYFAISRAYFYAKKTQDAYKCIMRAVAMSPYTAQYTDDLLIMVRAFNYTGKAIRAFRRLVEHSPYSDGPFYVISLLYEAQGNKDAAIESIKEALLRNPRSKQSHDVLERLSRFPPPMSQEPLATESREADA